MVINPIKYINYNLNKICNNEYGKNKNTKIYLKDKGIIMISKYIKFNFIYKGNHKLDSEFKLKKENIDFIDLENEIKILKFNNRIKNNIILFKSNNNNIHIISIINLFGINTEKDIFSKQIIENQIFYQNNTFKYEKLIKITFTRKYAFIDSDTNEIKIPKINTRINLSNKYLSKINTNLFIRNNFKFKLYFDKIISYNLLFNFIVIFNNFLQIIFSNHKYIQKLKSSFNKYLDKLIYLIFNCQDNSWRKKRNNMKIIYIINSYLRVRKLYYLIILFAFVLIPKIKSQNLNLSSINGSYIIMKINQGNNLILSNHENKKWTYFGSRYINYSEPNEIYINGIKKDGIKNQYSFTEESNTVILIWNYPITDCHAMFRNCKEIIEMDLSHFDTSHVTNMIGMFYGCENLISLDLSNFDTSYITNMHSMFDSCYKLVSLDLSNFNTYQVKDMSDIFFKSKELISLDLSSFDTSLTTTIAYMFLSCSKLIYINLKNADIKI
jgi:surface protein